MCVLCKLKDLNISREDKAITAARYVTHRRKAQTFYDKLNDVQDSITICFYIMENLVLPKTPICESYYSHQLYPRVLCIARMIVTRAVITKMTFTFMYGVIKQGKEAT